MIELAIGFAYALYVGGCVHAATKAAKRFDWLDVFELWDLRQWFDRWLLRAEVIGALVAAVFGLEHAAFGYLGGVWVRLKLAGN